MADLAKRERQALWPEWMARNRPEWVRGLEIRVPINEKAAEAKKIPVERS